MTKAYTKKGKEYESEIAKIRVEENLKIKEICERAGVKICEVSSLQNGMTAPVYLKGKRVGEIKPWVKKILTVLNCSFEDAFPRYVCNIMKNELVDEQINNITISNSYINPLDSAMRRDVVRAINSLPPRLARIIKYLYFDGLTCEEISKEMGISKQRVYQMESKAGRYLLHPKYRGAFI